ncbi:MAG: NAD(P)-dependent oxidoreductase [Chloroflexi bacterium]|nr:NAD(P)-dependent oxidoreductase [Chloroflexota bacterium]
MENVGFIGLGKLGTAMAVNIRKAGYPMVVHDAREAATLPLLDAGARLAGSPSEVAGLSDVVFTSLPAPRDVEAVVLGSGGLLEGIKEGAVYLDLTTCGPGTVRRLEPMFRQKGADMMDTPVLSTPAWAAERSLIAMAGGRREVFDRVRAVLDSFADKVVYTGGLGTASTCKLVNNMMGFVMGQVMAEGLTLGVKAGVDLDVLMDTGSRGVLGLRSERLYQTVFKGEFQPPGFTLALTLKDMALATEMARESSVPMPMANLMEQILRQCTNRGWAEDDSSKAFLLQEEAAGVEVRSSSTPR